MTPSYQTLQILNKVKHLPANKSALLHFLSEANIIYSQLLKSLPDIIKDSSSTTGLSILRANLVNTYTARLKSVRARQIFSEIDSLEREIKELGKAISDIDHLISENIVAFIDS
ncbi:MAG TPA: hypothetical protein VGA87_02065, partial [Pyrinomonadaceae bacterium]